MKRFLCAFVLITTLLLSVSPAFAACSTHTYILGGRVVTCTTCCFGGQCTTTCT